MPQIILVPVHLDALFLSRAQTVASSKADFTRLPYSMKGRDYHGHTPYLSDQALSRSYGFEKPEGVSEIILEALK